MSTNITTILLDDRLLKIEISNIQSGRDVSIDVKQFIAQTDRYQSLLQKIEKQRNELKTSNTSTTGKNQYNEVILQQLLEDERTFKLELLEYAKTIQRLDDRENKMFRDLKSLCLEGKLALSDSLLNEGSLRTNYENLSSLEESEGKINDVYDKLVINSQEFLIKARLTALDYDDPERFPRTLSFFDACLVSAKRARDRKANCALCLHSYGHFLLTHKQSEKATIFYQESVSLYEQLASSAPEDFRWKLAQAYNSLGIANASSKQMLEAEMNYQKAAYHYISLAAIDSPLFSIDYAQTQNYLGVLYFDKLRYELAEQTYLSAISLMETYLTSLPESDRSQLAGTYNNLGNAQTIQSKYREAETSYLKALTIHRDTAMLDSNDGQSDIALTLDNLSQLYQKRNELRKALSMAEESIAIRRSLANVNPQRSLPDLIGALSNKAKIHASLQEFAAAEKALEEGIAICRELAVEQPRYLSNLAMLLSNMGEVHRLQHNKRKAKDYLDASIQLYESLMKADSSLHRPGFAEAINNAAILAMMMGNFVLAESRQRQAVSYYQELHDEQPAAYLPILARCESNLGEILRQQQKHVESNPFFERAVEKLRKLADKERDGYRPMLAHVLNNLAASYMMTGAFKKAEILFLESKDMIQEFVGTDHKSHVPALAMIDVNLASLYGGPLQQKKRAIEHAQEAIKLGMPLAKELPDVKNYVTTAMQILAVLQQKSF